MGPLRNQHAPHEGFTVAYNDEVTEEQVRKIDEALEDEFKDGEWVTVEQEVVISTAPDGVWL